MMNGDCILTDSEVYYSVQAELLDFPVGLPLTGLPDSLPELNFDVDQLPIITDQHVQRGPPDQKPDAGKYDFQVEVNSSHTHKKKYVVSHKLNRIYVDKDVDFPVQFRWRGPAAMLVRATCVFADAAQQEKRVERCLSHFHSSRDPDPVVSKNVLHSSRPPGTQGIHYCGSASEPDSWLSVLVELHKPGPEAAQHAYRFTCKNSCSSGGINRRPIMIVFTLEDQNGTVHGRQIVGARACSCPRRDMNKDEESEGAPRGGKRRAPTNAPANAPTPPPAKVKRENGEPLVDLNLQLLTPQAAILGLEVMLRMEEQANEARRDPRAADVIAGLKHAQQELKNKYPNVQ